MRSLGKGDIGMDISFRDRFMKRWEEHFKGSGLPICFYFTDQPVPDPLPPPKAHLCLMGQLARVFKGEALCFDRDSLGCFGGKRYLGFSQELSPDFEHFLSCGIPGKLEGERYKKSPEIVREMMKAAPAFRAPARFIVFKRWDRLAAEDRPEVVVFLASPDVLSGLFTLAGFEESDPEAVTVPFAAGCNTIVQYPYLQKDKERPKAVLGMFDVSARPFVPPQALSFAVPMKKFERMFADMEESFLITKSWAKVRARLAG